MKSLINLMIFVAVSWAAITVVAVPCVTAESLVAGPSSYSVLQRTSFNQLGPQPEPPDLPLGAALPGVSHAVGLNGGPGAGIASGNRGGIRSIDRSAAMGTPMPIPPSVRTRFGRR